MSIELQALFGTTVLMFLIVSLQGTLAPATHGFKWGLGPRDEPRTPSVLQGRVNRIAANHMESMLMFAPLVIIAHFYGVSTGLTQLGAGLYFIGRLMFLVVYLLGAPVLRSVVWGVGMTGTILVGVAVGLALF